MTETMRLNADEITPFNENYDGITNAFLHITWEDGESKEFELSSYQFALIARVLGLISSGRDEDGSRKFTCHSSAILEKIMNGLYDPIRDVDLSGDDDPENRLTIVIADDYTVHIQKKGDLP